MNYYSVRGNINHTAKSNITNIASKYSIENTREYTIIEGDKGTLIFEFWLKDNNQKQMLFNELKGQVDLFGGSIDWHICTHNMETPQPCIIEERYPEEVT